MEPLVAYLGRNYERCPHDVLTDSHFRLVDGATVSPLLTLADDGGLYNARWDDEDGLVLEGTRHNSKGTPVQTTSEDGRIWARLGERDQWQQVKFLGFSKVVMQWLLGDSPEGAAVCASAGGEYLHDAGLCPSTDALGPEPVAGPKIWSHGSKQVAVQLEPRVPEPDQTTSNLLPVSPPPQRAPVHSMPQVQPVEVVPQRREILPQMEIPTADEKLERVEEPRGHSAGLWVALAILGLVAAAAAVVWFVGWRGWGTKTVAPVAFSDTVEGLALGSAGVAAGGTILATAAAPPRVEIPVSGGIPRWEEGPWISL